MLVKRRIIHIEDSESIDQRKQKVDIKHTKNKLTGILRYCDKEYYNKKLPLYKNDMKNTWKLLNEAMNSKLKENNFVSHFKCNDNEIYDKQEMANGFNDFFVNIGPELANNIDVLHYMNDRNVKSMFLHDVNKKEILNVINSFGYKTSTDYNGMNMFILKKITDFIVDPLLHNYV